MKRIGRTPEGGIVYIGPAEVVKAGIDPPAPPFSMTGIPRSVSFTVDTSGWELPAVSDFLPDETVEIDGYVYRVLDVGQCVDGNLTITCDARPIAWPVKAKP